MNTKSTRRQFTGSASRLRRARRLYYRLIAPTISAQPEALIPLAYRAKSVGMFAESTGIRDICGFMLAQAFKHQTESKDWWQWSKDKLRIAEKHATYYHQGKDGIKVLKKPRVRIMRAAA